VAGQRRSAMLEGSMMGSDVEDVIIFKRDIIEIYLLMSVQALDT